MTFADDWIRTTDLWCRKQPLYQLSHTTAQTTALNSLQLKSLNIMVVFNHNCNISNRSTFLAIIM